MKIEGNKLVLINFKLFLYFWMVLVLLINIFNSYLIKKFIRLFCYFNLGKF